MSRRQLAVVAAVSAALALTGLGRARLEAMRRNMARSSTPDAGSYDLTSRILFGPVFDRIARSIAAEVPAGAAVLDVGCGPGHLAIRLARRGRGAGQVGLGVTGVDLDPAMISRAVANAERAFAADDPSGPAFVVGDVAELPFADGSFDLVVSTFSLHHWSDAAAGFAELYRILRPAGRAMIWDLAGPIRLLQTAGPWPKELAAASPFGSLDVRERWSLGPIVLAERYDLVRPAEVGAAAPMEAAAEAEAAVEAEVTAEVEAGAVEEAAAAQIDVAAVAEAPAEVEIPAEGEAPAAVEAPAADQAPAADEAAAAAEAALEAETMAGTEAAAQAGPDVEPETEVTAEVEAAAPVEEAATAQLDVAAVAEAPTEAAAQAEPIAEPEADRNGSIAVMAEAEAPTEGFGLADVGVPIFEEASPNGAVPDRLRQFRGQARDFLLQHRVVGSIATTSSAAARSEAGDEDRS